MRSTARSCCRSRPRSALEYLELAPCLAEMHDRHPEPIRLVDVFVFWRWRGHRRSGCRLAHAAEGWVRLDHGAGKAPNAKRWEACWVNLNSPRHESGRRGRAPLRYDTGDGSRGRIGGEGPRLPTARGKGTVRDNNGCCTVPSRRWTDAVRRWRPPLEEKIEREKGREKKECKNLNFWGGCRWSSAGMAGREHVEGERWDLTGRTC